MGAGPADELRANGRQVGGHHVDRLQGREVPLELRVHQLEDALRLTEVAQLVLSQVDELDR